MIVNMTSAAFINWYQKAEPVATALRFSNPGQGRWYLPCLLAGGLMAGRSVNRKRSSASPRFDKQYEGDGRQVLDDHCRFGSNASSVRRELKFEVRRRRRL
jgi:hypothetical protein